jgi:uncharacterized protein (DUF1501 family)
MKVSRRKFISYSAGLILSSSHLFSLAARAATFAERKIGSSKILVVLQMSGGNDGLNTVIPYGFSQYYQLRPNIAIKPDNVLPLTGTIGLHPNMTALKDLYQSGKLAIILGVGYPNPNRSHFRSMDIWQTAEPERIADTGWIGRYLDLSASKDSSVSNRLFPAINVDSVLPKSLFAQNVVVPSIANINQFRFTADAHYQIDRQSQIDAFNKIYADFELDHPNCQLLKEVGIDAMQASDYLASVVKNYKSDVSYPDSGLARSLKFIAQMITAGVDCRVYNVTLGGFDTHAGQNRTQDMLLKQVSDALAAFQRDLEHHQADNDVIVLAFSEFGRRVGENYGRGTDHGTAEPVFLLGSGVRGGLYGTYPSLASLDNGDLIFGIDFRNIYATLADRWLKADSQEILGNRFEHIAFI